MKHTLMSKAGFAVGAVLISGLCVQPAMAQSGNSAETLTPEPIPWEGDSTVPSYLQTAPSQPLSSVSEASASADNRAEGNQATANAGRGTEAGGDSAGVAGVEDDAMSGAQAGAEQSQAAAAGSDAEARPDRAAEAGMAEARSGTGAASAPTPSASAPAPQLPSGGVYQVPIDALIERTVVNAGGQTIGESQDAVIEEDTGRAGVVVSVGGLVGIAGQEVLAPAEELRLSGEVLVWNTPHTPEQIKQTRAFDSGGHRAVAHTRDTLQDASQATRVP